MDDCLIKHLYCTYVVINNFDEASRLFKEGKYFFFSSTTIVRFNRIDLGQEFYCSFHSISQENWRKKKQNGKKNDILRHSMTPALFLVYLSFFFQLKEQTAATQLHLFNYY